MAKFVSMKLPETYYQWSFEIKDVVKFDETNITVNANTYEEAIKKVRALKLPQLRTYSDVEEGMRLATVFEVDPNFDENQFPEFETKDDNDD